MGSAQRLCELRTAKDVFNSETCQNCHDSEEAREVYGRWGTAVSKAVWLPKGRKKRSAPHALWRPLLNLTEHSATDRQKGNDEANLELLGGKKIQGGKELALDQMMRVPQPSILGPVL